ncbi:MAG: type toxin-antitoxin system RatA family toxin [Sphingomonadales bacterium]|jgi:coenzyme Q-binding protein COQ10|nr:type toxin-antitoxin system RatA family toxin [Sphingomonadales bacterium]MDB5715059.1 type toxin-antitoxin system RatA family toxin [Sphingomonadales bacterium]
MPAHREKKFLPHTPEQMFDLVADVGKYADFLPWVSAVRVRSDSPTEMVADLIVGFRALRERFTSRVTKDRAVCIKVDYIDGPLKFLRNDWHFAPAPGGCTIDFSVEFAFKNRMFEAIAGQMFDAALRKMINAFETRATVLYGTAGISNSSAQSAA